MCRTKGKRQKLKSMRDGKIKEYDHVRIIESGINGVVVDMHKSLGVVMCIVEAGDRDEDDDYPLCDCWLDKLEAI